jgi:hypothetical protein
MAIRVIWDTEEKTIVQYIVEPDWTWDEFFAAKEQANALMDTVCHKLGVFLLMPSDGVIPLDVLANTRKGLRHKHPNTVVIVVVSDRPFVRTMIETIRALPPLGDHGLETASTLDEARAIVRERLNQIPNDPVHTQKCQ